MQQHDVRGGCLVIQVFVLLNANLITKKEPMEPPIYRERSMLMLPKLWSLNLSSTIENSKVIFVIASFVSLDRVVNTLQYFAFEAENCARLSFAKFCL